VHVLPAWLHAVVVSLVRSAGRRVACPSLWVGLRFRAFALAPNRVRRSAVLRLGLAWLRVRSVSRPAAAHRLVASGRCLGRSPASLVQPDRPVCVFSRRLPLFEIQQRTTYFLSIRAWPC